MATASGTGALVLFSGGQDSTVCLAHALDAYARVETVGFFYGQRHEVELACRQTVRREIAQAFPAWGKRLGPDHVIDMASFGAIGETSLTSDAEIVMLASGLPSTFVPGRNLVFLTFAVELFLEHLVDHLIPILAGLIAQFLTEFLCPARDRARVVLVESREHRGVGQGVGAGVLGFEHRHARDRAAHLGGTTARARQVGGIAEAKDQLLEAAVAVWANVFVDWHLSLAVN